MISPASRQPPTLGNPPDEVDRELHREDDLGAWHLHWALVACPLDVPSGLPLRDLVPTGELPGGLRDVGAGGQQLGCRVEAPRRLVVREMFRRYVEEQEPIAGLVRWLRAQGVPSTTGKPRWDRSTLWGMLRNPAYCGRAAFGKTRATGERPKITRPVRRRGARVSSHPVSRPCPRDKWVEIPVPPIVSEEVFALAARRLEDNKHFASRRTKVPSLLQGIVACQSCGYSYYRTSTRTCKRMLYYYCCLGSDDYRYEGGRICRNPPVRQDYLDGVVWDHVTALLADPQLIRAELERRLQESRATSPVTAQKASLERELRRTERTIQRLVEAYQEELITLEELRRRMPELRRKITPLRTQLEALEAQAVDRETYLQLAENLEGFLKGPLFRPRLNARSRKLAERAMDTATMYRLIQDYLDQLPGAVKEDELADGRTAKRCVYTPHSLRATAATLLLDAGVDITSVQDLLGHKHVSVTQMYDKRRRATKHSASHQVPL